MPLRVAFGGGRRDKNKDTKAVGYIDTGYCDKLVTVTLLAYSRSVITEVPAYSDTLGTGAKCHCKQISAYSDTL